MQPLERAVAIFCIACICAELTTQLGGQHLGPGGA